MNNNYFNNLTKFEHVKFGKYWQGTSEKEEKTQIEWLVASVRDSEALLISSYCLDCGKFNNDDTNALWKDSDIRKWLNGYFYSEAFSDEEKGYILEKEIINNNNVKLNGANDSTLDKIFLLSLDEVKEYFETNESRMVAPTKYAVSHNSHEDSNYKTKEGKGTCYWWTRTIGNHFSNTHVAGINYFGYIGASGNLPSADNFSIRPALWIKI